MLKLGVRILGIRPELVLGLMIVKDVYAKYGAEFVITSVVDGVHSKGSLHYAGAAVDLRLPSKAMEILLESRTRLGPDFDFVGEVDHLHLEYQPKEPY